jgi:hypothetical protein
MYCFRENSNFPFSNQNIITLEGNDAMKCIFIMVFFFLKFNEIDNVQLILSSENDVKLKWVVLI